MSLTHAILATLADRDCSGYDLAKQFDGSVGFFWQATHQQIYRELTKLEKQGFVSAKVVSQSSRPNKKLYSLTQLGQQQLAEWIAQPCDLSPTKEELLVKLFAGHLVDLHVLLRELERHHQLHQAKLSVYRDIEKQFFQNPDQLPLEAKCQYLTLRRGIRYEIDWIAWCEEAIKQLEDSPIDQKPESA